MATIATLDLDLPRPHVKQRAFLRSPAKRKVIVAGRRSGKTTGTHIKACESLVSGGRILQAAPTSDQTDRFWELCKAVLDPFIDAKFVYKNESKRILEFRAKQFRIGGNPTIVQGEGKDAIEVKVPEYPRIRTKTAWDADTLRGDYADELFLEEYSLMDPSAWNKVGAPMLLDNDGDATFIFTPQRKNHAFQAYVKAQGDDTGRWAAWHFTSHDNPHLSKAALAEITADMTEDAYKQEILAQFLDNEGAVFRNIAACLYPGGDTPEMHADHETVIGIDWGKSEDYTVASVGCRQCKREVELDRFHGIDYRLQQGRIQVLAERWGVYDILAESNAMGDPIITDLQYLGLPVRGFQTTAASKPQLIESLVLSFERTEVQFIDDPVGTSELEAFEMVIPTSPGSTGRPRYGAPEGLHDDTVIARALMNNALQLRGNWVALL
jgi:hypothetical protein